MIRRTVTVVLLAATACGGAPAGQDGSDIGQSSHRDTIIQSYDKTFQFKSPRACSPYVFQRIVDTTAYVGEYDARVSAAGARISATYLLKPKDPFPLQLDLSLGKDPPFLFVELTPTEVRFSDANGGTILDVQDYAGKSPTATGSALSAGVTFPPIASVKDAIAIAQCELPAQSALGFIPGFFVNKRESVVDPSSGVTAGNADAPAVVASWSGSLSILQAYEQAFACLTATGDATRPLAWACSGAPHTVTRPSQIDRR